jgi:hypothetical protein
MSYRFLPFVRRGLADRIPEPDAFGATIASRARFTVDVALSAGGPASVDLRVHGPGDVIGVDPRNIVRTAPPRFARNVAPEQFAAIEFDAPDFPWMFTPAKAGTNGRLRPWLVLVVVAKQPGVAVVVKRDRPLPQLTAPREELPNLAESWAWAHTHMVEEAAPASVGDHLATNPELNVSRLLCPRRLEPNVDYIAALVPAFEHGRLAGLADPEEPVPTDETTGPAWSGSGGPPVTLPVYYHWEFRTGPSGDFESLARQLVPRPVPDTVGRRRMFIGAAHRALPALPADDGGVIDLEGALRAPEAGEGPTLGPEHRGFQTKLTEVLDAPAAHVLEGASADAEAVAPPIYGGRHVQQETLAGTNHKWLTELNTDPRHRAAAGLGTEIVRLNQERFVHAAWEQVGDVLAANAALDRARFLQRIADRVFERHVKPLPADMLLSFTAAVHARTPVGDRALSREVGLSTVPDGALDASFRRLISPRSTTLTRAARHVTGPSATVKVQALTDLAEGRLGFDVLSQLPDGLVSSRLIDRFGRSPTGEVGPEIGAIGTVPAAVLKQARELSSEIGRNPVPTKVTLRPDLAKTGVLLPRQLDVIGLIAASAALEGAATSKGRTTTVAGLANAIIGASLVHPDAIGYVLPRGARGIEIRRLELDPFRPLVVTSTPLTGRGRTAAVALLETRRHTVPQELIREVVAGAPPGSFLPGEVTPLPIGPFRPPIGRPPVEPPLPPIVGPPSTGQPAVEPVLPPSIDPPIKAPEVVRAFVTAFEANVAALELTATSIIPPEKPLALDTTQTTLIKAIDPHQVIEARAQLAVRIGDVPLRAGVEVRALRQRAPLDPVMAAPDLPEPLYKPLADADPDRFLPGIGEIPDDTLTLLETNPRFVEAFMVGANHEMNRELMWRRYPTDRRGTPFRRFWDRVDRSPDIGAIHEFQPQLLLGTNSGADLRGSLVLLVRGQLLRRYPESVVYAAPANPDGSFDPSPSAIEDPIFWGRINPDVTFVGFDLTREDVEPAPGWYFVLAEQPTAPRFGLDVPPEPGDPAPPLSAPINWAQLHWDHVGVDPGGHLSLSTAGLGSPSKPIGELTSVNATWGRNSADMAAITFQRPFRAIVHTSKVLDGQAGKGLAALRPVYTKATLLRPIALPGGGG